MPAAQRSIESSMDPAQHVMSCHVMSCQHVVSCHGHHNETTRRRVFKMGTVSLHLPSRGAQSALISFARCLTVLYLNFRVGWLHVDHIRKLLLLRERAPRGETLPAFACMY